MDEVFQDLIRIRILVLLASTKDELSLIDFTVSLKLTRAQTLPHVKNLRKAGILGAKKRGTSLHYRIKNEKKWMPEVFKRQKDFVGSEKQFAEDLKRFTRRLPKSIRPKNSLKIKE